MLLPLSPFCPVNLFSLVFFLHIICTYFSLIWLLWMFFLPVSVFQRTKLSLFCQVEYIKIIIKYKPKATLLFLWCPHLQSFQIKLCLLYSEYGTRHNRFSIGGFVIVYSWCSSIFWFRKENTYCEWLFHLQEWLTFISFDRLNCIYTSLSQPGRRTQFDYL